MSDTSIVIPFQQLEEFWIHTGTACNLECPFCLEGSRPGDTRLERIKLNEIRPYLDQAAQLGAQRFYFTGGEPLIVKDIVKILEYALNLKPCIVISNGTAPLLKRLHQLQLLKQQMHPLSFYISLDHPDQQLHDKDRGWGNFQRAIEGLQLLHVQGFAIAIVRQIHDDEDQDAVLSSYKQLLRKSHLPEDTIIHALPDFGRPGISSDEAPIDIAALINAKPKCSYSRMLLKRNGKLNINSCLFTDDDVNFEMGNSLESAVATDVAPTHHRCHKCGICKIEM
ncbi:MAG TPA: radical SAM protein [Steroidobacteraceae bacterium]|nr:radical SAM protein [Steroidobacteraceae bacterium]